MRSEVAAWEVTTSQGGREGPRQEGGRGKREGCVQHDPAGQARPGQAVEERGRWGPGRGWPPLRNVARGTHSFQFFQGNKVQFGDISQFTIFILKTLTKPNPINQSDIQMQPHGLPDVTCGF